MFGWLIGPAVPPPAKPARVEWEYKVYARTTHSRRIPYCSDSHEDQLASALTMYGSNGWELVHLDTTRDHADGDLHHRLVFRRPKD